MLRMVILAGLVVLGLAVSPAVASEVLQPSGPWKIDYAPNECRLLRTFGTGDTAVTLRFARGAGLDSFDMLIAGKGIPKFKQKVKVKLSLTPGGAKQEFDAYSMAIPGRPERFVRWFDGSPAILDAVTDSQQLDIGIDGQYLIAVDFAKGKAALGGLNHCFNELLEVWGIDPAKLKAQALRPIPRTSPGNWVSPGDYPTKALIKEQQGKVVVVLTISTEGKVADCRVVVSSQITELDNTSCRVLVARAHYFPAKDSTGQPIEGFDVQRIRWFLPDE